MNASHILAVAKKQFQVLRHDPRTVALMLLAPIMAMLIFGFAFGTTPQHIPIIVTNSDDSALAKQITASLDHTTLNIQQSSSATDARLRVRNGAAIAALIFPASNLITEQTTLSKAPTTQSVSQSLSRVKVSLYIDTTNQQLASIVSSSVAEAFQHVYLPQAQTVAPLQVEYAYPNARSARYIDYFVPGIIAFAITLFTTLLTLLAFIGERSSGTLDRLKLTPLTDSEIVLGYELAFGIIAAIQGILVLAVAVLVYHILVVGSFPLTILLVILTALDAQVVGVMISSAARRESQAVQFIPFIIFPVFLLSGVFVPIQSLPSWLQPFSYILPTTWTIDALRDILLRGWGIDKVGIHVLILFGFACIFTAFAILRLHADRVAS